MFIPGTGEIKHTSSPGNIPPGAVLLSGRDVKDHQLAKINSWKPQIDVCMLRYGNVALGVSSLVGGIVINMFFRNRFKLRRYGFFFTLVPTTVMPFIGSYFANDYYIRDNLLLGYFPCTVCAEMRSGIYQAFMGALYPTMIAPPLCATFARQHMTFPIPSLKSPNELVKLVKTITPSYTPIFTATLAAQFIIGALVAGVQIKQYYGGVMSRTHYASEFSSESMENDIPDT